MIFTGNITEIKPIKSGETKKGDKYSSLEFEVTESKPNNPQYPQVGLFSYFKMGEFEKYASEFNENFKLGDEVEVDFNLKKNSYTKDGEERSFYKTECWTVKKADSKPLANTQPLATNEEEDSLPF